MLNNLFQTIQKITPLGDGLTSYLKDHLKPIQLFKKEFLLTEGNVCRNIYFVADGFLHAYYVKDEKEITSWFMGKGEVTISVHSFFTQRRSTENIQVLADITLFSLGYEELQYAYQEFTEMNMIGRVLTEQYYILSEERAIALRQFTARERYENLLITNHGILQKASLGQIASHLGISQETLSRVRAQK